MPGRTLGQVIDALDAAYPGAKARLCEGDRLKPGVVASVDGRAANLELLQPVGEHSEVSFHPAVGGG